MALVSNVAGSKRQGGGSFVPEDFFSSLKRHQVKQLIEATTVTQEDAVAAAWNQWGLKAKSVAASRGSR